jgi:hypothetical protein
MQEYIVELGPSSSSITWIEVFWSSIPILAQNNCKKR